MTSIEYFLSFLLKEQIKRNQLKNPRKYFVTGESGNFIFHKSQKDVDLL